VYRIAIGIFIASDTAAPFLACAEHRSTVIHCPLNWISALIRQAIILVSPGICLFFVISRNADHFDSRRLISPRVSKLKQIGRKTNLSEEVHSASPADGRAGAQFACSQKKPPINSLDSNGMRRCYRAWKKARTTLQSIRKFDYS